MTATIHRLPRRQHVPNLETVRTVADFFKDHPPDLLRLAKNAIRQAHIEATTPWDRQHTVDNVLMAFLATGLLLGAPIDAAVAAIPPNMLPR